MQAGGLRRYVERRVMRAVGNQRQRHQHGDRHAQEADQFIQTMIFSWSQNAHTSLLAIGEGARRGLGARALSRGSHPDVCKQRNDYIKGAVAGKGELAPRSASVTERSWREFPAETALAAGWRRQLSVCALGPRHPASHERACRLRPAVRSKSKRPSWPEAKQPKARPGE